MPIDNTPPDKKKLPSRREFLQRIGKSVGGLALTTTLPTLNSLLPATAQAVERPNIVLFVVDSLRSDHVSAYGYHRNTTPNLDAMLAARGVRFQQATTTNPWTFAANAALMSGRTPLQLGVTWDAAPLPTTTKLLAEYLHAAGYYTAGFVNNYYVNGQLGFSRGFDHFDDTLANRPLSNKARASEVNTKVTAWLEQSWQPQRSSQPLFLFVYYFDPHVWYTPPAPYNTLYDPSYSGPLTGEVYQTGQPVITGQIVPQARDVEHLIALYDGEITYWDAHLGQMLKTLQAGGILSNALTIVTADHGEMFGEHGKWTHSNSLYEEVLRVPLVMSYPGVFAEGRVLTTPVQHLDILPTILDAAGIPIPASLAGVSLQGLARGLVTSAPHDIISMLDGIIDPNHPLAWLAPDHDLRAVRRDQWKLLSTPGNQAVDELYQLEASSIYEVLNRLPSEHVIASQLRDDLRNALYPYQVYLSTLQRQ